MKNDFIKIGIIIPDRNDRMEFLGNCIRMIENQYLEPTKILLDENVRLFNYPAESSECDITQRYRRGYESFSKEDVDCILLMENDDYYSPAYINTMVNEWINHGKPEIFGTNYTYYYHLGTLRYEKFVHLRRASAMNTLIVPGLDIKWPIDSEPYTDLHLWKQLNGVTFEPEDIISIGIKHNVGKTGGQYHNTKMERYKNADPEMQFLKKHTDDKSFNFYKSQHAKIYSSFE